LVFVFSVRVRLLVARAMIFHKYMVPDLVYIPKPHLGVTD